jgi:hypothetical protein
MIEGQFQPGDAQRSGSSRRSLRGMPGRRLLRRRKEQIGWHTETGAQTLHHRHAEPLFATQYFTDAAWCPEQRDEVSSREAVLIHQMADQIGDAWRPARPFHFLVRGNQANLRFQPSNVGRIVRAPTSAQARNSSASPSIRMRVISITRPPHRPCRTRHAPRRSGCLLLPHFDQRLCGNAQPFMQSPDHF